MRLPCVSCSAGAKGKNLEAHYLGWNQCGVLESDDASRAASWGKRVLWDERGRLFRMRWLSLWEG